MAQNVIGLDLGSHSIKAVVVKVGLRGSEVALADVEPVTLDENGMSTPMAVLEAAGRMITRLKDVTDNVHCAVPGEMASLRRVELPLSAMRRIEQVLRFELDDLLPYDVEDAVFDYVEVDRTSDKIRVLAAVVLTDNVKELVSGLVTLGVDPREVGVASLAYMDHLDNLPDVTAIVDIGHTRTNVAILGDGFSTSRTILRGGRDLTLRLATEGKVSFSEAESHKRREGMRGRVGEVLAKAAAPISREILQTLKGHLASGGKRVKTVLLCGGGSLVEGMDQYLANELGVRVERHRVPMGAHGGALDGRMAVLAYALAKREEVSKANRFNVRQGVLTFKGDYEFLKRRVAWVIACVFAILGAWIFSNYAEYNALSSVAESQKTAISEATTRLCGKDLTDRTTIEKCLGGVDSQEAPVPEKDAFDIVLELSRRIPVSVVHDVELLDIKPKRITITAIVNSELEKGTQTQDDFSSPEETPAQGDGEQLSPTDLIQQKLAQFEECFTAVRIDKVQSVDERRKYQMDIESKCP